MKVDFLGNFKQVQKLINATQPAAVPVADFQPTLESAQTQDAEIIKEIKAVEAALNAPPKAAMARFNFSSAPLILPEILKTESENIAGDAVKTNEVSVKTPSGVTARVVEMDNLLTGLNIQEKKEIVGNLVSLAGKEHGVDPALSLGVIKAESNFNPIAVSSDGHESKGLMQLLDSTGKDMMARLGMNEEYSPFDPVQNIDLGVGYLKRLHEIFSAATPLAGKLSTVAAANSSSLEKLAVAAYNAGEGRVASAQQRAQRAGKDAGVYENIEGYLPEITRTYVKRVLANRGLISEAKEI